MIAGYYAGIGSRETPADVQAQMTQLARELRGLNWIMRSGAAAGADDAFERGSGYLSEIYIPWPKFPFASIADRDPYYIVPQDPFGLLEAEAQQLHPAWGSLSPGARKLMVRNMCQIDGEKGAPKSSFVICWTPVKNGVPQGGTSQAIRLANKRGVPVYNLYHMSADQIREQILLHNIFPGK